MYVEDLDIAASKITEAAQRVIDRAAEETRRRDHALLTSEHLFNALAQVEWDLFAQAMRDADVNPHDIVRAIDEYLRGLPSFHGGGLRVSSTAKLVCKLAVHHASRSGRGGVEPADLLLALLEDSQSVVVSTLRQHGADPDLLVTRFDARMHDWQLRRERLKKRFDLPPYLKQFATNLNFLAWQDKLPPVFGRDRELQQVLEILCHRERANSVMLVGEPGVGKTAIAEGLARRLEFEPDSIPVRLRDCQIVNLQMNTIVSGTMLRGMFEERVQHIIREVKERPHLVLFVDEAHTMVGAGSALGAPSDAAQIFKSVLARGEVRMIAATTLSEYKQHIQEDDALARRFRCVHVSEPSLAETRRILYNLRPRLERNYAVKIPDEAVDVTLEMAPRYLRHLHLPDKVIGWLDTAAVHAEMDRRQAVTEADVVTVISQAAQIPEDMVFRDVTERFAEIDARLQARVVGQRAAVQAVARRLLLNKGPLKDGFDRPDGVLLFLGPTGVGKTELAKAVAEFLFGDAHKMIRIDMSEYQDGVVAVDKLIGMPRGIAGSDRGGVLTNQLRDNPYSVVLLDEIEKAAPNLLSVFLQAFDEGWLTDGRGRRVYLSDAIVIMTSNLGSEHFRRLTNPLGFLKHELDLRQVQGDVMREVERRFAPEFRNRIDEIVLFSPLSREDVRRIAEVYLDRLRATLARAGRSIAIDDDALEVILAEGHSLAFGARFLKRVIDERIKAPVSARWREGVHFHVTLVEGQPTVDASGVGERLAGPGSAFAFG